MKRLEWALALCLALAAGCDSGSHGHDHKHDHDHDHGSKAQAGKGEAGEGSGGHHHTAPHGGALVALGDHFALLEVKLDAAGRVDLWALDKEGEAGVRPKESTLALTVTRPGKEPITVKLKAVASSLTGETRESSSHFAATDKRLEGVEAFEGRIERVTLKGRVFEGVAFPYPEGRDEHHD